MLAGHKAFHASFLQALSGLDKPLVALILACHACRKFKNAILGCKFSPFSEKEKSSKQKKMFADFWRKITQNFPPNHALSEHNDVVQSALVNT